MATVKRRRPGSNGATPEQRSHASDSTGKRTGERGELTDFHERVSPFEFDCPRCGKRNTARRSGDAWLVKCFGCELAEMADVLGCAVWELLEHAPRWLEPYAVDSGRARRPVRPDPLPSEDKIRTWRAELPFSFLERERGLTAATAERFEIGWDRERRGFTYPIRDASGALVNVSWRAPRGRKLLLPGGVRRSKHRLAGRTAEIGGLPFYPQPLPPFGGLLVEGEPDALLARQHGLPAFTGLLGKQWSQAWDAYAAGREIAVAYDVGAEEDAAATVDKLRRAGARRAWVVPLGLPNDGDDIGDWFVKYGRTADELLDLIRRTKEMK